MAEYIKREAAIDAVNDLAGKAPTCSAYEAVWKAVRVLKKIPAADVAPVVHGVWIRPHWKNSNYCCDCSECGGEAMHRDYQWDKNGVYPICPNCGAKMDGGKS